jgi:hypothetical protein
VAWHPYIYVPFEVWEVIVNFPNSVDVMAQLIHAEEHLHAQKQMGKIWWLLKYCLSKKFRFDEEIKAIYAEMKFMKKGGFDYDIEQGAKFLSSWCYFGMTNRRKARNRLSEMWRVL